MRLMRICAFDLTITGLTSLLTLHKKETLTSHYINTLQDPK